ncbi:PepSY-associated TM helix domain-containing protein [Bermanella sp. R86510]|uniref:PepSY-associated TM helix domain-containing protein n=1 Tax=unclassified Bermanella TaxID=2627862 RepID=UPI0037C9257B
MSKSISAESSIAQTKRNWLPTVLTWHWVSSAIALCGIVLFSITGITLNHSADIPAQTRLTTIEQQLPTELVDALINADSSVLPNDVEAWLQSEHGITLQDASMEWSEYEIYASSQSPGADAWLSIELPQGFLIYEHTDRGWIAYLNDLHKGRHTGAAWNWYIDILALACLVFSLTGFVVLCIHAKERHAVWPITFAGLLVPVLLALLFIH